MSINHEEVKNRVQVLVVDYKENGNEESIAEVYEILTKVWREQKVNRRKLGGDAGDQLSFYHEQFAKALVAYTDYSTPFMHLLNRYIKWGVRDAGKKLRTCRKRELMEGAGTDGIDIVTETTNSVVNHETFEQPTYDLYPSDLREMPSRKTQLAAISSMMESATDFEKECATLFVKLGSLRKVAKELDAHPMKVSRAIGSLAKRYDGKSPEELFTVPTIKSRK